MPCLKPVLDSLEQKCFSFYRENILAPTFYKLFPSFANFSGSLREPASSEVELESSVKYSKEAVAFRYGTLLICCCLLRDSLETMAHAVIIKE